MAQANGFLARVEFLGRLASPRAQSLSFRVLPSQPRFLPELIGSKDHGPNLNASLATVVELLIAQGADVNTPDKWGRTPLSRAADKGHKQIVAILQAHGGKE